MSPENRPGPQGPQKKGPRSSAQAQRNERMIFVSDTLRGAFGRAWRFARRARRRTLWEDFAERPIFSVGAWTWHQDGGEVEGMEVEWV